MKSLVTYFKNVHMELAHVKFPTKKETLLFSILVIALSVGIGYFLGAVDFGFIALLRALIN
jgi:preprotein translocase SecE subunit